MLYTRETRGTVDAVVQKLTEATKANQFGVLGVVNLKAKMQEKGVEFGPQCVILEVCNPRQAKKVLEREMAVSTALPCRISVYEDGDKVTVATLRPTALLRLFGAPELEPVAREVEETILRIIDAACA
jgi:uncharacterized protein (DUF302 family)